MSDGAFRHGAPAVGKCRRRLGVVLALLVSASVAARLLMVPNYVLWKWSSTGLRTASGEVLRLVVETYGADVPVVVECRIDSTDGVVLGHDAVVCLQPRTAVQFTVLARCASGRPRAEITVQRLETGSVQRALPARRE